jgi:hypothetical protein
MWKKSRRGRGRERRGEWENKNKIRKSEKGSE